MERQFFGTDGIRGPVGTHPITADFMLKLGWAIGRVLDGGASKILIGKDTRISGYMLESALQAGLASSGANIYLLGPLPTPAVAYMTTTFRAGAGIVVSASHNPFHDNGVKFFTGNGRKFSEETELAIEARLADNFVTVPSEDLGKAFRIHDAVGRYIEFCKSTVHSGIDFRGLRIVVDCAHGATYNVAPSVFRELGADVIPLGVKPNGLNINETGANNTWWVQAEVLKRRADLGVAFDGDGDRVMMVDHRGEVLDGDEILFVLAKSRRNSGAAVGGVVGTTMSNLGLEHGLAGIGVSFARAEVGDRFVQAILDERGWQLGGESSGHVICRDKTSTGDGIIASLQVVQAVVGGATTLHDIKQGMIKYPQAQANVRVPDGVDVMKAPRMRETVDRVQRQLDGRGRVLLRRSGTEPVVRVVVESRDEGEIQDYLTTLAGEVRRAARGQQHP